MREAGLFRRLAELGARDGGVVLPGRYVDDDADRPTHRVRNEQAMVEHARRLADRVADVLRAGGSPLVVGGDCSVLLGAGVAMARRGGAGLVHVDGHTDFRNPGNSDRCASVAGEDLAVAVGRHRQAIADIDGCGPYFAAAHAAHVGCRDDDAEIVEVRSLLGCVVPASEWRILGTQAVADAVLRVADVSGYWLQVDVDVLDPEVMPAVDSPDPGGCTAGELVELLRALAPRAVGASVTVFDPDLDPDGRHARLVSDVVVDGLSGLGSAL
ncbi:arginase (plasmid) [Clavibacter capsici]|nr:arginase [Clavibacter capsici]